MLCPHCKRNTLLVTGAFAHCECCQKSSSVIALDHNDAPPPPVRLRGIGGFGIPENLLKEAPLRITGL